MTAASRDDGSAGSSTIEAYTGFLQNSPQAGVSASRRVSPPRRMLLILNGKSADRAGVRDAVAGVRNLGHSLDVRVTWEAGDARRYAAQAAEQTYDVVIAGGGDGTISEAVRGLCQVAGRSPNRADKLPTLAALPLGTANDWATSCGLPVDDPLAALLLAAEGVPRGIDVGLINGEPFVNLVTASRSSEFIQTSEDDIKRLLGGAAYSLVGFFKAVSVEPCLCSIQTPAGTWRERLAFFAVGNGRTAGGGYAFAPRALLDDGLLDLMAVPDVEIGDIGALLGDLFNLGDPTHERVLYHQAASLTIETDLEMQLKVDGEPLVGRRFEFGVLPRRLSCILPQAAPLQSGSGDPVQAADARRP